MAYIEPNTRVLLLTGVPLDETYEHTLYFDNITAQTNYFMGQRKYEFTPQTYQRKGIGVMTVQRKVEDLYDCGYLMFQNTSFGNKWFYAFVLDVEYVNNITTRVYYQIDYLQTWWFDITIHQCWVEREHIAVDTIGANLQDEGFELGELQTLRTANVYSDDLYVCVASTVGGELYTTYGNKFDRIITPDNDYAECSINACYLYCFAINKKVDNELVLDFLFTYLEEHDQLESVVSCFVLPSSMVNTMTAGGRPRTSTGFADTFSISRQVKNNKLLQYPFNILEVTDNAGTSAVFRPELFDSSQIPQFSFGVTISPTAEVFALPELYNGVGANDVVGQLDYAVIGKSLPQIPFSTDSYKVWVAQNSTWFGSNRVEGSETLSPQMMAKAGSDILHAAGAGAVAGSVVPVVGTALGAASGALGALTKNIINVYDSFRRNDKAKLLPDKYNSGTGATNIQLENVGLSLIHKSVNPDYAKRIDDFFEMFGYKTNDLKIPNTHSRPHWNYVKTTVANITGNIPSTDIQNIKAIFNNGITFWKNPSEVGNYSLNNH